MSSPTVEKPPSLTRTITMNTFTEIPSLPKSVSKPLSKLPISRIPMPRIIFWLTCLSSITAFLILPVSLLDMGGFSLYVNPVMSIFTLVYHAVVFVVSQQPRQPERPTYFWSMAAFAIILDLGWIAGLGTTAFVFTQPDDHPFSIASLRRQGLPVSMTGHALQMLGVLFESVVVGAIGVKGLMIYYEEGEPDSWRPPDPKEEEDTVRHPSVMLASLLFAEGRVDSMVFDDACVQKESARPIDELPRLETITPCDEKFTTLPM